MPTTPIESGQNEQMTVEKVQFTPRIMLKTKSIHLNYSEEIVIEV